MISRPAEADARNISAWRAKRSSGRPPRPTWSTIRSSGSSKIRDLASARRRDGDRGRNRPAGVDQRQPGRGFTEVTTSGELPRALPPHGQRSARPSRFTGGRGHRLSVAVANRKTQPIFSTAQYTMNPLSPQTARRRHSADSPAQGNRETWPTRAGKLWILTRRTRQFRVAEASLDEPRMATVMAARSHLFAGLSRFAIILH